MVKKKKMWRLLSFVLMIVVLFVGYNVYSMFSFFHSVSANKPFSTGDQQLNTAKWEGKGIVNILFMGVDRRDTNDRPRSDTMLLASINPDTKNVTVFSIMRDTYVDIPGVGKAKINAAFANGGPELLIDTIQKFLKIPIHYYVATDFEGFSKIIDAIGGIDVNVPEDFVHADDGIYDINLKKGQQHLNGQQALEYVRFRGTPRADFDRTERQREVVKLIAQKMKTPSMLVKAPQILKTVEPYTQSNLGDNLFSLASLALSLDTSKMKMEQIPPVDALTETYVGGESVLLPNVVRVRDFVQDLLKKPNDSSQTSAGTGTEGSSAGDANSTGANGSSSTDRGTSTPTSTESRQTVVVTGEVVNLRAKPGTEYNVIGQVYRGDVLTVDDQVDDWYYVQTARGMYGYIAASLVQWQ